MQDDKDLSSLKALAEAATPGPWELRTHPKLPHFVQAEAKARNMPYALEVIGDDYVGFGEEEQRNADAAYIAAANPAATLSLISRIEQQAARIAELEGVAHLWKRGAVDLSGLTRYDYNHARDMMERAVDGDYFRADDVQALLASPARHVGGLTDERVYELVAEHELCTRKLFGQAVFNSVTVLNFARAIEREVLATKAQPQTAAQEHELSWFMDAIKAYATLRDDADLKRIERGIAALLATKEAEPVQPNVWQSMESAPQDGTEILIRYPKQGNVKSLARFNTVHGFWWNKGLPIWPAEQGCEWTRLPSDVAAPSASQGEVKVPEGFVLMPKALTAENGAKSALTGEFKEVIQIACTECDPDGESCAVCDDAGTIDHSVPIGWSNIKAIYARAVELLAAAPSVTDGEQA